MQKQWSCHRYIEIKVGGWRTISAVYEWFRLGTLDLKSSVASDIVILLKKIKATLQCPLVLGALPQGFLE